METGCSQCRSLRVVSEWTDDETVRVAVGLRLGLNICVPHVCRCEVMVDARGLQCFVCKCAPGRTSGHHALNDIVARAFASAAGLYLGFRLMGGCKK